ncbi:MAG: hypothetical protein V1834_00740 [Candidatus Micrarchaeota archaeon]
MEVIILLALLLLAWFFASGGSEVFAFIILTLAILYALLPSSRSAPASRKAAAQTNQPVVIHTGSNESIPSEMKIKVKPDWSANDPWETFAGNIGKILDGFGRTIAWVFRGFKKP